MYNSRSIVHEQLINTFMNSSTTSSQIHKYSMNFHLFFLNREIKRFTNQINKFECLVFDFE